jgi:thioredoxin-like negative regulator of GroEL
MNNDSAGPVAPKNDVMAALPRREATQATTLSSRPFFRRQDWIAFLITFSCVWLGYYLTLAPEVTLEDSGELATGSFYAGIPHPPGYPVWTIYTWLWTVILPIKNVAWRVALGEATSGALAAGLLALLVARGSSLLIDGIEDLKNIHAHWLNRICPISGFVAGMLLGFNGFMWSQSVIVEVYSFSVASLIVVLLCLLRWIYAPQQRRYLYLALFFHGICFTNHQTLIVAAMGIEVAIAAANFRMGRYLFLGNAVIYLSGLILKQQHILTALEQNQAIFVIFNVVGVVSIACYCWFSILSAETLPEFCLDGSLAAFFILLILAPVFGWFSGILALCALAPLIGLALKTRHLGLEWLVAIGCGCCWILGAAFYFYMPLAGMTNPPMEWGYPRTVEGFVHAFTRGQYEKTNPTDIIHDPLRFITQLSMLGDGIIEEFNWLYSFLALVPFAFFFKLHKRERAWLIGITAIYLCLGVLLLILLNPPPDRAAQQLVRVFFTASHTVIALLVGYGITLVAASMAQHYQSFRFWGLAGGAVALALAIFSFTDLTGRTFFGDAATVTPGMLLSLAGRTFTNSDQYGLPVYAGLILIGMAAVFVAAVWNCREQAPLRIALAIFALMPLHSILTHWSDNEQRNHWFGYYFGHDMFTPPFRGTDNKPLYPEMPKDAVLFGGTDPGRFCPTYMIFCDSFVPHRCQPVDDQEFDRRDVYLITQNALADGTYLEYIRAQYHRSAQVDPPFFQELFRSDKERHENTRTNALARLVNPLDDFFETLGDHVEERRRTFTSWFKNDDFLDVKALTDRLGTKPGQDALSRYLYDNLRPDTQRLMLSRTDEKHLRDDLARDLNELLAKELKTKSREFEMRSKKLESEPLYTPVRFQNVPLSEYLQDFISQNPQSHTRIRLNRLLLEAAYPGLITKSLGGVYPDREIYTPTSDDSARAFNEYAIDAQRRLQTDQLKPGEEVRCEGDHVQISGPSAVMAINGLLTKVIFEHNPKNQFFVEESFALDWMYPYLSPYGIIMRINRQPLPELTEDAVKTDHAFWTRYSTRLTGNWIRYETSVKEIADWTERVYLRRNFRGFEGDRKFIRDDQAQKSFSKLRSAIAGVYAWRVAASKPGSPERQRMLKEADFAFRQAFAFCPYNPDVLFRYANLLISPEVQRLDDALLLAKTSQKLDPFNESISDLVNRLQDAKAQRAALNPAKLEQELRQEPANFQIALNLASEYFQLGQTGAAFRTLERLLDSSNAPPALLRTLLQIYATVSNQPKVEQTVERLAAEFRQNPADLETGLALAEGYRAVQKPQQAAQTLDEILNGPKADAAVILRVAQQLVALTDYPRLEIALEKLTEVAPGSAESWYDFAALKSILGKQAEALRALRQALKLNSERHLREPNARDLLSELQHDPRFNALRALPEFKDLASGKR